MAGLYHPMDWVKVYESHTPYEWLVQQCLAIVDPWGDDRDDLRAAINTMAVSSAEGEDREKLFDKLRCYLKANEKEPQAAGPQAIRMLLES